MFRDFSIIFLIPISSLIPLWSENILYIILILSNLLRLVLWLRICSSLVCVSWGFWKGHALLLSEGVFYMSVRSYQHQPTGVVELCYILDDFLSNCSIDCWEGCWSHQLELCICLFSFRFYYFCFMYFQSCSMVNTHLGCHVFFVDWLVYHYIMSLSVLGKFLCLPESNRY